MRHTNKSPAVGEDITVPRCVARNGKIRIRSEEAAAVARWFGLRKERPAAPERLPRRRKRRRAPDSPGNIALTLAPGTITLITGPSGAGKSSLLRQLRSARDGERPWIDLGAVRVANVPVVNCFGEQPLLETLKHLGRVGLGEAWSYLRTPAELSEGQKFRLRLAIGLHRACAIDSATCDQEVGACADDSATNTSASAKPRLDQARHQRPAILACDEFAAMLDRLTAMIVARCVRRAIDAHPNVAAVLATSHDDLIAALRPDVIVRCDFGRTMVEPRMNADERREVGAARFDSGEI